MRDAPIGRWSAVGTLARSTLRIEGLADEDQHTELTALTEPLLAQLDLAVTGRAEGGWSSVAVVDYVASLCGRADLISWVVQP